MPVVAAIGIFGGAAAIATGTLTVLQTIAAIGSIVSGIGTLTGNKTLAKIGAVASLAGGIGAFAQSKGWLATASAADTATDAAQASFIETAKNAPSGAEFNVGIDPSTANFGSAAGSNSLELGQLDIGGAAHQGTQGLAGAQSITDTISQASAEVSRAMGAPPQPRGLMDVGIDNGMNTPEPGWSSKTAANDIAANKVASTLADTAKPGSLPKGDWGPDAPAGIPGAKTGGSKILDIFNDAFRDKDGKLDKTMLSLAGNFVGGMFDSEKEAREELYRTRAESERRQMANASAVPALNLHARPKPGGTFRPNPPTYQPVRIAAGGLFNAR